MHAKLIAAATLALLAALPASAQPAEFAGSWRIDGAVLAPWAVPGRSDDRSEERRLVGKTVTFGPRGVAGPSPLGCARATYATHDYAPDMLFEGTLAEPDAAGQKRDPVALARGLGLTTPTARTLETGCSEVSFHRFAPDALVFGLNDRVYTLRRVAAARR